MFDGMTRYTASIVMCVLAAACDQNEGATDTAVDTPTDTVVDTGLDSVPDEGPDSVPDVGPDTAVDTATDTAVDVGPDVPPDTAVDTGSDTTGDCGPSWHPTSCGDCGGGSDGTGCYQSCVPSSCGDGRGYMADCDTATMTCHCYIDDIEVCTCTPEYSPSGSMGCQPEEWGGANCCWNVG